MDERELFPSGPAQQRAGRALIVCLQKHAAAVSAALAGDFQQVAARTVDVALARLKEQRAEVILLVSDVETELVPLAAALPDKTALVVVIDEEREEEAHRAGATDVVVMPRDAAEVTEIVRVAMAGKSRLLLGDSEHMTKVRRMIGKVAPTPAAVLIRGETGSGKELVARAIHEESSRREGPFVAVNCPAIPDTLIESELFGYERGAFTDAVQAKPGFVDRSRGGTLFLDEIGDLSANAQAKVLRLYAEGVFERIGGKTSVKADVRLIAATHQNLEELVKARRFREDLFYRIRQVEVWAPPLRARRADIAPLAQYFCTAYARAYRKGARTLGNDALAFLRRQRWPGNVRELEFSLARMVLLSDGPVLGTADAVSSFERPQFDTETPSTTGGPRPEEEPSLEHQRVELERAAIVEALAKTNGVVTRAAQLMGVARSTLYEKMRSYGIEHRRRSR